MRAVRRREEPAFASYRYPPRKEPIAAGAKSRKPPLKKCPIKVMPVICITNN